MATYRRQPAHPLDTRLKRARAKRGQEEKIPSLAAREQRELVWMLFVTEGYIGNVMHALAINAYTLNPEALKAMQKAVDRASATAAELRALMQQIEKRG